MRRVGGSRKKPRVYNFRTIADLSELPLDLIRPCLTDLMLWLQAKKLTSGVSEFGDGQVVNLKPVTPDDAFAWIDDGRHVVTIQLHVKGAGGL